MTEAVQALLAQITKNSPLGVRLIKQLINDGRASPWTRALRLEVVAWESYGLNNDIKEGLRPSRTSASPGSPEPDAGWRRNT